MERNEMNNSFSVNAIVKVGLMAAVIFVAAYIVPIKTFMGVMHAGDSMVFLAALLLGKKKAAAASAIGMSLFDITLGYITWAPFTFVIKALMAYITAEIAYRGNYKGENIWNNILAFIIGGIWMIAAYYFSGAIILTFLNPEKKAFTESLIISLKDVPTNIAQAIIGIVIALPLYIALSKSGIKDKI
ncbi:ECF transporter S component [Clostridium prolinivorans]|jgi:uncharacterized membrane protein|uniref:ECF transporter S component n=1 Tax=Clostridium prolinivorans TaxID=2769420 RepID=UPI000FDC68B1|nr:ECF transporter S component [Clostridium prolinivorans]